MALLTRMTWKNLKDGRCPKCSSLLQFSKAPKVLLVLGSYFCPSSECDFKISEKKFDEIVDALYHPKKQYQIETDGLLDDTGSEEDDEEGDLME